jgi:HK97 family phage portal protein
MGVAQEILEALESDVQFPQTVKERQKQMPFNQAYQNVAWVYACVNLIGDCISGVTFNLSRGTRKKELVPLRPNDPAFVCFYPPRVGEIHTLSEMIKMQYIHLGIFGESFATLTKKGKTTVTGVELFNPALVVPVYSQDGLSVDHWNVNQLARRSSGGKSIRTIAAEDMIQWKYPNPYDRFRGLSPLAAARMAIEQDMNMATWNSGFFQNGIRNPIALMLKQTFNPSQREEFMNRLRRNFTGFVRGHLPLLVEGGVDVKVLSNTIKDLDFVEGKGLTREELCAVYNMPPAQVGIFRYANYANSKEQRSILYLNNLRPKMRYYRDVFQQAILTPYFPGVFCDFAWDEVDAFREDPSIEKTNAEAMKIRAEAAQILWNIGYDQKQIAVVVEDPNFDPSTNQPDLALDNIFDMEQAAADAQAIADADAAAAAAEAAAAAAPDPTANTPKEPKVPKKGVTYAKAKGLIRLYADSETLRDVAIKSNESIIEPLTRRMAQFVFTYLEQAKSAEKKTNKVGSTFWATKWRENVEPILDEAFAEGVVSVDRDLRILRPAEVRIKIDYEKYLSLKYIVLHSEFKNISDLKISNIIHRAFVLGRLCGMENCQVNEIVWCCAGDSHKRMHGVKTKLGRIFDDTNMTYPGEGKYDLESCTCTVFPTEAVREDRVAIIKKA